VKSESWRWKSFTNGLTHLLVISDVSHPEVCIYLVCSGILRYWYVSNPLKCTIDAAALKFRYLRGFAIAKRCRAKIGGRGVSALVPENLSVTNINSTQDDEHRTPRNHQRLRIPAYSLVVSRCSSSGLCDPSHPRSSSSCTCANVHLHKQLLQDIGRPRSHRRAQE
jgi:hypothetical protein